MQLVIIAGGKGTRLGLKDIPKPMVKIGDKPLLEHQIELAKKYGINEIFILSGYLANVIEGYFGNGSKWGVKIHHIVEPYPLGTAGAVKLLEGKIKERFMIFYGDLIMDFDIQSFIDFDKQHNSIGTLILHPNDHPHDSDLMGINEKNIITDIYSKPHDESKYYRNLINAAVYIFSPKIFSYIEQNVPQDFGKDIFKKLMENNETLIGYDTAEYIKDMGTKDRFQSVANDFVSGKVARLNKRNKRPCIFLDRDGVINMNMNKNLSVEGFELLDGVSEAIKQINKSDYLSIVVTNHPMVAKGFIKEEANEIHKKMETLLGKAGAFVDEIYYWPHYFDKDFKEEASELKTDYDCRKQKLRMLLNVAKEFNIDLANSWMIGDSDRDLIAGKNAGCKTVFISKEKNHYADFNAADLQDAVNKIMGVNI